MNPVIKLLISLRLTVWLLGISVLLVFLGSIAQVPEGLWNAQVRWFHSWFVIRRPGDEWWVPPIFPGGHLLGSLLLLNLVAAHVKRFKWEFHKFGIFLTHIGIVVMIVGQGITHYTQRESFVQFFEGQQRNYTQHHRDVELIFAHDKNETENEIISFRQAVVAKKGELRHEKLPFTVRVLNYDINGALLTVKDMPRIIDDVKGMLSQIDQIFSSPTAESIVKLAETHTGVPQLRVAWRKALRAMGENDDDPVAAARAVASKPARVKELAGKVNELIRQEYLEQLEAAARNEQRFFTPETGNEHGYAAEMLALKKEDAAAKLEPSANQGIGKTLHVISRDEIKDDQKGRNYQWAVIELLHEGKSLGTWLVSARIDGQQEFEVGGAKWRVALRNERYYLPGYALELKRAQQEVFQGTSQASSFASRVRIINPSRNEDRETEISMNMPLRYEGLTFFQSTMNQGDKGPGTAAFREALTGKPRSEFQELEEKPGSRMSGFQVVENPSMVAPYTGCLLVGFGMLWQFLYHLTVFLAKRTGLPSPSFGVRHPLLPICAVLILVPDVFLSWIALQNSNIFALAVVAVTPFMRAVLAWQVAKGRFLVFAVVILLIPTLLTVPFAFRYWDSHGSMLGPVMFAQFAALLGIVYVLFNHQPDKLQEAQA